VSKTAFLVVSLLAAGAVGAGVATLIAHEHASAPETGSAKELQRVVATLEELSSRQARLEQEVRELRLAPPLAAPAAGAAATGQADPAASEASGDTAAAASPSPEDAKIEEKVRTAVAASRAAEMDQIGQRFARMAKQREVASLDRLAESHGLSAYQREEMEKILDRRREAIGSFFRTMFGAGGETDPEAIRTKLTDVQKETDEAAKALLTPEQYEEFKKTDIASRAGPWGMGGGMGGPGGDGGQGNPGGGGLPGGR
jgi:hypothetical protein